MKRKAENRGLPARWRYHHGAYVYRVPPTQRAAWGGKTQVVLGKSLPEAYRVWAEKIGQTVTGQHTIADLLDAYALRVVPTKAVKTQASNTAAIKQLRKILGHNDLRKLQPQHVYQYVEARTAKVAAHREVEVLSHAYTKAVEWGWIDRHPFKGQVRLAGEKPRDRYIEDWEVVEALALRSRRKAGSVLAVQAYIRLKLLTGLRQGDLLRLRVDQFKDDGIHVQPRKTAGSTGKRLVFAWTPERRAAVEACKAARPVDISPWLFCNRRGECYVDEEKGEARGWKSMWQRFMERVLVETKVTEPFTEHDLRAKAGSDAESLERARQLLGHADAAITERVYRRKPERIA